MVSTLPFFREFCIILSVLILSNRFCGLTLIISKPVNVSLGSARLVPPSFNVRRIGGHKSAPEISKS